MKKRVLSLFLCAALAGGILAGCTSSSTKEEKSKTESQKEDSGKEDSKKEDSSKESETKDMPSLEKIDVEKCITLGEYKGIDVEKQITPVTDEMVDTEIAYQLSSNPVEVTEEGAKVESGDTVNIDYVGKIDGKEFEGGSAKGSDLIIGSGSFIEGFEDGLVGTVKGQTVDLNLTFPKDYNEELGGKDVVFTVTVNVIKRPPAEATDEWVAANTNYKTAQEYREGLRKELEEYNNSMAEDNLKAQAWQQVVTGSTIKEYPEELVAYGEAQLEEEFTNYAQSADQPLDEYLEAQGISKKEYESQKEEYAQNMAAQMLVLKAIQEAENFTEEDKEYKEALKEYQSQYAMKEDELYESFGKNNVAYTITLGRIGDMIVENANITEKTVSLDETGEETAE